MAKNPVQEVTGAFGDAVNGIGKTVGNIWNSIFPPGPSNDRS